MIAVVRVRDTRIPLDIQVWIPPVLIDRVRFERRQDGYDPGDRALNGKVEGNVKGTYGNKKPVQRPRDFLGIHQKDLQKILKKYPLNNEEERLDRVRFIKELEESAEDIVAGLTLDEDFG